VPQVERLVHFLKHQPRALLYIEALTVDPPSLSCCAAEKTDTLYFQERRQCGNATEGSDKMPTSGK
jgi:hypothetical protein